MDKNGRRVNGVLIWVFEKLLGWTAFKVNLVKLIENIMTRRHTCIFVYNLWSYGFVIEIPRPCRLKLDFDRQNEAKLKNTDYFSYDTVP